jgi:hypothetical protein
MWYEHMQSHKVMTHQGLFGPLGYVVGTITPSTGFSSEKQSILFIQGGLVLYGKMTHPSDKNHRTIIEHARQGCGQEFIQTSGPRANLYMQVPLLQVEQRTDGGYDLCTQWWQEMNAIHHHNAITQLSFHKQFLKLSRQQ